MDTTRRAVLVTASILVGCSYVGDGAVVVVAADRAAPSALAIADGVVYWTELGRSLHGDGVVARVALAGGAIDVLAAQRDAPGAIALAATDVLWLDEAIGGGEGAVLASPRSGGALRRIAEGQQLPVAIAFADGVVYWTSLGCGAIRRVVVSGGPVEDLAIGRTNPRGVIVEGRTLYWYDAGSLPQGGPPPLDGAIVALALDGGMPGVLVAAQRPTALAIAGDNVCWIDAATADVTAPAAQLRCFALSSGAIEVLADHLHGPSDLVIAEGWLYFADGAQLARVALGGGPIEPLALAAARPLRLAVGGGALVWTDGAVGGAVRRLNLPR